MIDLNYSTLLKKVANFVGILLVVYCLSVIASDLSSFKDSQYFQHLLTPQNAVFVFILSVIHLISLNLLGIAWHGNLISRAPQKRAVIIGMYGYTQIGKYLPGNVFHFAGRQLLAKSLDLEQAEVFKATLREIISHALASIMMVCLFLGASLFYPISIDHLLSKINAIIKISHTNTSLILFVALVLVIFAWQIFRFIRLKFKPIFTPSFLLFIIFHLLSSLMFAATLWWFGNIKLDYIFLTLLSYVFAWLIGYVIPGAPAGVGIREVILLMLLKGVYQEDLLLTAVLANRLITTLADFYFFGQACWIKHLHAKNRA